MKDVMFNLIAASVAVVAISTVMVGIADTANQQCNRWVHTPADCAAMKQ
jgi:hypothetical protein